MPLSQTDLALAKLAVELRVVTQAQVEACLREASDDPPGVPPSAWPLGDLLVRRGFLSPDDRQRVEGAWSQRTASAVARKEDILFGRICVVKKYASPAEVSECLELQKRLASRRGTGDPMTAPRIGELMIERGYLSPDQVKEVLREQRKFLVRCAGCGRQYNVVGLLPGQTFPCKKCGATVTVTATPRGVSADETVFFTGSDTLDKGKPKQA